MKDHYLKPKYPIKSYWFAWLFAVAIMLLIRFTLLRSASEHACFWLFNVYALTTWLSLIFFGLRKRTPFLSHLQKNHPSTFNAILSRAYGTFVVVDPISGLRFSFSKRSTGDPVLDELRDFGKGLFYLIMTVFVTYPILFLIIML